MTGGERSVAAGRHRLGALLAVGALVAACGPGHFARAPQVPVDLSGHWIIDPAASDDAAAMIAAVTPKPPPRPARDARADATAGGDGQRGPAGGSRGGGRRDGRSDSQGEARPVAEPIPSWGRIRAADFLAAFARPPRVLEIEQSASRVSFGADERRRDYVPGDEEPDSVTDRFGSRRVSAGWQHEEFVINSQDGSRLHVLEHYRPHAGDRLESVIEFHAQGIKSLTVHSVYRRATAEEIAAATADGPPAPPTR